MVGRERQHHENIVRVAAAHPAARAPNSSSLLLGPALRCKARPMPRQPFGGVDLAAHRGPSAS
jgi:hypothetical protein